jgi:hypothetical protein
MASQSRAGFCSQYDEVERRNSRRPGYFRHKGKISVSGAAERGGSAEIQRMKLARRGRSASVLLVDPGRPASTISRCAVIGPAYPRPGYPVPPASPGACALIAKACTEPASSAASIALIMR